MTHVYNFHHDHGLALPELKALIGGKAANLNVMATRLGLPVPPGFTITTATCRAYLAEGWPAGLDEELHEHMHHVEERVGRRFGDPADPLLVSVRSGAVVSMPGMMDTILNLGLNEATVAGLAAASGDAAFATDCHRRFVAMFRDIVGMPQVPEDPWLQLRAAVEAVFRSWNSDRAQTYRRREGIPDDLGTAVTIQTMVFGNRGAESGTGVLFTRNPATGEHALYGDVMFNAQGEDVVAGTHETQTIGVLDERLPEVAAELRRYAAALERHYADLCDIEFTIEQSRLWMLQVRVGKRSPQAALRIALEMAEEPDFPLTRREAVERVAAILANPPTVATERRGAAAALAIGLGASPGVACGEIVVTPDAAVAAAEAGHTVILVRAETSPDDVHGMARAAGVLTSSGGLASHAAVVARGWGIPAVVGAKDVRIAPDGVEIGARRLAIGEVITIDGGTGEIFAGEVVGGRTIVPEAAALLAWARELGIAIDAPAASPVELTASRAVSPAETARVAEPAGPAESVTPAEAHALTPLDALRAIGIKGFATPTSLADAMLSTAAIVSPMVDHLVADGLAEAAAGSYRLTVAGKTACRELIAGDTSRWGEEPFGEALETFLGFDLRMKDTVTSWQTRDVDGETVLNDHTDATYDGMVLEGLAALHADTVVWLRGIRDHCRRFDDYLRRLERSLALARAGDARYVASPRVDSYHGIWFELHEELIRLAGRRRSDEVAAGRA